MRHRHDSFSVPVILYFSYFGHIFLPARKFRTQAKWHVRGLKIALAQGTESLQGTGQLSKRGLWVMRKKEMLFKHSSKVHFEGTKALGCGLCIQRMLGIFPILLFNHLDYTHGTQKHK